MAYRRKRSTKRKTPYRRKRTTLRKRRRKAYKKKTSYTLMNNISLGRTKIVRMCYSEDVTLTPPAVAHAGYVFRPNSIYDPNYTGTGHRCFGEQQYRALYNRYEVQRCYITATIFHAEVTGDVPVKCGIFLDKDGTLDNNLDTKIEQVHGRGIRLLLANSREKTTVQAWYDPRTFFNKTDIDDDHQQSAPMGANPTAVAFAVLWVQAAGNIASLLDLVCQVRMEYVVKLSEPIPLAQTL